MMKMEKKIICGEDYNPYKILDRISDVLLNDYGFEVDISTDVLENSYIHFFDSGFLRIKITNNTAYDNYFHVEIDHAEHVGSFYNRTNLNLDTDENLNSLLDKFKNSIHKYKDDLTTQSHRMVMINSLLEC